MSHRRGHRGSRRVRGVVPATALALLMLAWYLPLLVGGANANLPAQGSDPNRAQPERLALAPDGAPTPTAGTIVVAELGQSDRAIVEALPAVDVQALLAAEGDGGVPQIIFQSESSGGQPQASGVEISSLFGRRPLPDTLLLFSGDWYGPRLRQAADAMELDLSPDRLAALENLAVARGVNTRLLLVLAKLKSAPARYGTLDQWVKWLYLESARIRAALGPFSELAVPSMRFRDGVVASFDPRQTDPAAWALTTSLGAGGSVLQTQLELDRFDQLYAQYFQPATLDEAQQPAAAPFLYRPFTVALDGRAYFDHTYPSVDYGATPNVPGMLDYLGRSNTGYDSHDADDLGMPYGSDVIAPVSGTVWWIDNTGPDYGLLIRYPGSTYDIVMVHLSQQFLGGSVPVDVRRGQLIGRSGIVQVPHIHFEVRHNGKQTDTMGWAGGGSDPCATAPANASGYRGCEESIWLWLEDPDGNSFAPPASTPPATATRTATASPTATTCVPTPTMPPTATAWWEPTLTPIPTRAPGQPPLQYFPLLLQPAPDARCGSAR